LKSSKAIYPEGFADYNLLMDKSFSMGNDDIVQNGKRVYLNDHKINPSKVTYILIVYLTK